MDHARYAVLIASSEFPDEPKLQPLIAPPNDVDGIASVFRDEHRGNFTDVTVLKNRPYHEILRELQRTLNKASKEDLVVIYYSGHGKLNRAGELYLTAIDTVVSELESSAIPVSRLRSFIDVSPAQRVVMILDSCFSGAAGDVLLRSDVDSQLQIASSRGRGTYIMTASTGIQTAQEKEADRYSVFTKHLIEGIRTGEADSNRDGQITADELYDYVDQRVRQESHQEPTRWNIDVRGHFVLAKSGRQPRKERENELRAILFELVKDNRINDEVLTTALGIIKKNHKELSNVEQKCDELLDTLRNKQTDPVSFLIEWYRISHEPDADTSSSNKDEDIKKLKQTEAKQQLEDEARKKEQEAKRKAEEEDRKKAEEAKRKVDEEKRKKAEEVKLKAEEEQKKKEEIKRRAEEERTNVEKARIKAREELIRQLRNSTEPVKDTLDKAVRGDAKAQYIMGVRYQEGISVEKNKLEALRWFHKASEQGYHPEKEVIQVSYPIEEKSAVPSTTGLYDSSVRERTDSKVDSVGDAERQKLPSKNISDTLKLGSKKYQFFMLWMFATYLGVSFPEVLLTIFSPEFAYYESPLVIGSIHGLGMAVFQGFIFRNKIDNDWIWPIMCVVVWPISWMMADIVTSGLESDYFYGGFVGGSILGGVQAFLLFRYIKPVWIWGVINAIGWAFGFWLAYTVEILSGEDVWGVTHAILWSLLFAGPAAVMTAIVMSVLFRKDTN